MKKFLVAVILVLTVAVLFAFYAPTMYVAAPHSERVFYKPCYESMTYRLMGEGSIYTGTGDYYICSHSSCVRVSAPMPPLVPL